MSYILDAIKKAESQRRQDRVPTLEDLVASGRRPRRQFPWKTLLILVALAAVVAVAYVYREPIADQVARVYKKVGQEYTELKSRFLSDAAAPSGDSAAGQTAKKAQNPGTTNTSKKAKETRKKNASRFPADVQTRLDRISFTVVSYSVDPEKRFVMVGANVLREGDFLDGFRILHIVREGVMLDVNGQDYLVTP